MQHKNSLDEWYPGEWCNRCNRRVAVGFWVPDEVWAEIVGDPNTTLCLPCFDELSDFTDVEWNNNIEFYPTSNAEWQKWLHTPD